MISIREMGIADYDKVIALWEQSEGLGLRDADSRESIASYLALFVGGLIMLLGHLLVVMNLKQAIAPRTQIKPGH